MFRIFSMFETYKNSFECRLYCVHIAMVTMKVF